MTAAMVKPETSQHLTGDAQRIFAETAEALEQVSCPRGAEAPAEALIGWGSQ